MAKKKFQRSSGKEVDFEESSALKTLFREEFEKWSATNPGGFDELARRCGVSSAYLAHVRRYGRIPGRPVLYLLALNFDLADPQRILDAAGIHESWPFGSDIGLARREKQPSGFISLKIDMEGFTNAIQTIVRGEMRHRNLDDLVGKRPLRLGYNHTQDWMFAGGPCTGPFRYQGVFPSLCELLGVALQRRIETVDVDFRDYVDRLTRGDIDMYGPLMAAPHASNGIRFTDPLYRLGVSALCRLRETEGLEKMPLPKTPSDLRDRRYKIAVLRNSFPHLIAGTRFHRTEDELVVCDSDAEAVDRLLLRGIRSPAHVYLFNSVLAKRAHDRHPTELAFVFSEKGSMIDVADNAIAVRPDWPELLPIINESLRFILRGGGLAERFSSLLAGDLREYVEVA